MHHQFHADTGAASFAPFESIPAETSRPEVRPTDFQLLACVERIVRRDQDALAELYDETVNRVHGVGRPTPLAKANLSTNSLSA